MKSGYEQGILMIPKLKLHTALNTQLKTVVSTFMGDIPDIVISDRWLSKPSVCERANQKKADLKREHYQIVG